MLSSVGMELKRLARADWTRFNQRGDSEDPNPTAIGLLAALVEPYAVAAQVCQVGSMALA